MPKDYVKYIARQNPKIKARLLEIADKIEAWDLSEIDYKKMSGVDGAYRARVGKFRLIFVQTEDGTGAIVKIETRGDIY